jgi:hypothetical protein
MYPQSQVIIIESTLSSMSVADGYAI